MPRRSPVTPNWLRPFLLLGLLVAALGPLALPVAAADGDAPTMEARVLLGGHARVGSWMAIEVRVRNDGPSVVGELRLAGGPESRTRFGTPVDLPTGSDKLYLLYAQPPGFGREIEIELIEGADEIANVKAEFAVREAGQLVVAIVAEQPQGIIAGLDLMPNQQGQTPVTLALEPADLPSRVEAWGAVDRVIWQDVDSNQLEPAQLDALRGWLAGGGRMIIAGGTAGAATLSAFPDALLPYRPLVTTDAAPSSLAGLLGQIPETATDVPALSGELLGGRALATVGDQVIAAERAYGSGLVTVIGFNPATPWIGETEAGEGLWRRLLPPRSATGLILSDDNQLINAVSQLPALALPPIGGLLALLGAYILLIGPVNYLVLRRLDRREWAWITMPLLIVVFAVGAYGFGAALRGSNVIINEVAIVRGAPGATDGTAQVYLGVFSPSRETYQMTVPGGALLSAPLAGDVFGGEAGGASLDVLQGEPARVRNLAVGFGSLRAIRAETPTTVPLIESDLALVDGRLTGTVRNASEERLEKPAVVLGSTVAVLRDLEPGGSATVDVALSQTIFGQGISDKVVGSVFFPDSGRQNEEVIRQFVRHSIIDQLTYDPIGGTSITLPSDGPVILAWGTRDILDVEISGQQPRRTGNVLYYLPTDLSVSGKVAFGQDLLRSSIVETDAAFFSKDPYSMNFGRGSATLAYRPIPFEGTFRPTSVVLNLGFGGDVGIGGPAPKPVEPLESIPPSCDPTLENDCPEPEPEDIGSLPDIELLDLTGDGTWRRLPRLDPGLRYEVRDPAKYVEPATGTILIRFVNEDQEGVGFSFGVELAGEVQ